MPTESTRASPSTVANESHVGVNPADSEATPRLAPLKIPPAIGPRSEHQENHQMPSIEQDKDMTMSYTRAQTAPLPSKHRSTRYRAPIAVMSSATSGIEDTVVEVPEETVVDGAGNGLNHVGQNQLPNHREEEPQDRDHPARDHEAHSQTIDHGRHEEPQSRGPDHTAAINPEQGNGEVDNIHPNRGGCDGSEKTLPSEKPLQKNEAAATAAPKVQFTFVIILARYPWQEREWTPQGKFLKKTLSQLKSELPTGFAEASRGIMFRLGGPGVDTEQPVFHGQDRKFDSMKKYFNTQIREEMDKYTNGETLPFRIEIEALQEAFLRENKEDEDELF